MVEIKHVDLPEEMRRAMAAQAQAERNRRAKVINAEGEYQASRSFLRRQIFSPEQWSYPSPLP
jgi:regulator of protease activity HflC (stomatin/prohibitin superfamily)